MMLLVEARTKITLDNSVERSTATGSYTDNQTAEKKQTSEVNQIALLTQKVEQWNEANGKVIDKFRNVVVDALINQGLSENGNPLYYLVLNASDSLLKKITYSKASKFQSLVDSGSIKTKHVKNYLVDDEQFWSENDSDVSYKFDILDIFFNNYKLSKYKKDNGDKVELGDIMDGDNFVKADKMRELCSEFFEDDDDDDDDGNEGVSLQDCLSELSLPKEDDKLRDKLLGKDYINNKKHGVTDKNENQLISDFVTKQLSGSFSKTFKKGVKVPIPVSRENCVVGIQNYYEEVAKGKPGQYTFQTVAVKNGWNDKASQLTEFSNLLVGTPDEADDKLKLERVFNSAEYTEFLNTGKLKSTATKDVRPGLIKYLKSVDIIDVTGDRLLLKEKGYRAYSQIKVEDRRDRIKQIVNDSSLSPTDKSTKIAKIDSGVYDKKLAKIYSIKNTVSSKSPYKVIDNELRKLLSK